MNDLDTISTKGFKPELERGKSTSDWMFQKVDVSKSSIIRIPVEGYLFEIDLSVSKRISEDVSTITDTIPTPSVLIERIDEYVSIYEMLSAIQEFEKQKRYEKGLKMLFPQILKLYSIKDFNQIDSIISKFVKKKFDIKTVIGLLTITYKCKSHLLKRGELIEYAKKVAYEADYSESELQQLIQRYF